MTDHERMVLDNKLLGRIVAWQTYTVRILWVAGLISMVSFLQSMIYTSKAWIMIPFPFLVAAALLCRRRARMFEARRKELGLIPLSPPRQGD